MAGNARTDVQHYQNAERGAGPNTVDLPARDEPARLAVTGPIDRLAVL